MIRPNPKTLDDIAAFAGGAVNILSSMRAQVKNDIRARLDEVLSRMDLVSREEVDVLNDRVTRLAKENEALKKRLDAIESKSGNAPSKKSPAVKPVAKTTKKKK